ncbi:peptide deformylase [Arthrobacter sp. NPDC090010]|uniref:peptide deformylase n=1 Tax=Arthrobacter sp. NPDC090010 TaxID=3363942 RepID=UPI0038083D39
MTSPRSDWSAARLSEAAQAIVEADTLPSIVQLGHPVLRSRAMPFEGQLDGGVLAALIDVMHRTVRAAPGVGLAAPQIGLPLRLAVIEDWRAAQERPDVLTARSREPLDFFALLNPEYAALGEEVETFYEGCLSMDGFSGVVGRAAMVSARWQDSDGVLLHREFSGWQARIIQHETDHLEGTIYVDKVVTRSLTTIEEYAARWSQPTPRRGRTRTGVLKTKPHLEPSCESAVYLAKAASSAHATFVRVPVASFVPRAGSCS